MASSIIVLNQSQQSTPTTSQSNDTDLLNRSSTSSHSSGQLSKLKINLNDVVVTAAVADSLISPCINNKSSPLLKPIILSEELNNNLTKTYKESSLNKFSISDSNLHKRASSDDLLQSETKNQEFYISNLTISNKDDIKLDELTCGKNETKHTRFKIRYHYNSYSNYQQYNEQRADSPASNSSNSTSSSTSPVLSTDSNLASPTLPNLSNLDPLAPTKMDDNSHAFKFSSILVSSSTSKLKEDETIKSDDENSTSLKVKMVTNLKIQPNKTPLSTDQCHHLYLENEHEEKTTNLAINGKSFTDLDSKEQEFTPKLEITTKKEKKRVSFNDSLLQVHLIPNVCYNSLSIEKFKYQLKTTTITMENNSEQDEENEMVNYETIPKSNDQAFKDTQNKQININFYKPSMSDSSSDQGSKTSFVLSSSLISLNNDLSNNYQYPVQSNDKSIMPNSSSKLYRTTIFKTFQETNDSKVEPIPRKMSASRENSYIRNNQKDIDYKPVDNKYTITNKKKETNSRIGSSTSSSSNNNTIYQNQRSYSSILASTFSTQPHMITNYSFSNQLQIKQQQQQSQQAQIQVQSNSLTIPFHSSALSPAVSVLNDDTHPKVTKRSTASPANQFTETKNENAVLRVNSGSKNVPKKSETHKENHKDTEVHQSLAMSFELTPQLKFLSNLKTPKQTTNLYINSTEMKDLIQEENQKNNKSDDVQVQMHHNSSRKSTNDSLSAPIIANLSAGLFKQKFSAKAGSTKYIFLKSDDKQSDLNITPSSFSSSHFNALNKSYSSNKIGFNTSAINPNASYSQLSEVVKLGTDIKTNAAFNSNAKSIAMSTVNQLFALKDVNYYVANSSRALRKYHQQQNKNSQSKSSSSNSGEVTTIKLASFSPNQIQNDRQTKSALPLLRSSAKTSSSPIVNNSNDVTTKNSNLESKNLNNCFNNLSYRLINTPTLIGNLSKAKTFLYNQNANNNFDKRIKENSNDKTSL